MLNDIKNIDLETLMRKLEQEKARVNELEQAIELVVRMLKSEDNNQKDLQQRNSSENANDDVYVSGKPEYYNFTHAIKSVVKSFHGQEFGVSDVDRVLRTKVNRLPRNPKSRIAMVLQGFVKKGQVIITFRGLGSVPYKYKEDLGRGKSFAISGVAANSGLSVDSWKTGVMSLYN